MINVLGLSCCRRPQHRQALEQPVISSGVLAPGCVPLVEILELDAEDGGLQRIEPGICADDVVIILDPLAVVPQPADFLGDLIVVGGHQPAVPVRAKILAGIETESGRLPKPANPLSPVTGSM